MDEEGSLLVEAGGARCSAQRATEQLSDRAIALYWTSYSLKASRYLREASQAMPRH